MSWSAGTFRHATRISRLESSFNQPSLHDWHAGAYIEYSVYLIFLVFFLFSMTTGGCVFSMSTVRPYYGLG